MATGDPRLLVVVLAGDEGGGTTTALLREAGGSCICPYSLCLSVSLGMVPVSFGGRASILELLKRICHNGVQACRFAGPKYCG